MLVALIVLGVLLLNVVLAYVPIILIVGYNLSERARERDLLERYVLRDEVSTERYVELVEGEWGTVTHAPLTKEPWRP